MPRGNQQYQGAAAAKLATFVAPEAPKKQVRRPPSANAMWVPSMTAQAILQVNASHLAKLKNAGTIRVKDDRTYNLKDVLDKYHQRLQADGLIDQRVEAVCIRGFKEGA